MLRVWSATKLCRRSDFLHVQRVGKRFLQKHVLLLVAPRKQDTQLVSPTCRLGYTVSSRVGKAVVRNLVKRRLRAIVHQIDLGLTYQTSIDYVVIALKDAAKAPFSVLNEELRCLWQAAKKWVLARGYCLARC